MDIMWVHIKGQGLRWHIIVTIYFMYYNVYIFKSGVMHKQHCICLYILYFWT